MPKLSDADRLTRLFAVIEHLSRHGISTIGELVQRFGGGSRGLYDDLVSAWLTEDPSHLGLYPFPVHLEYFEPGDPDAVPVARRRVWLVGDEGDLHWLPPNGPDGS